MFAAPADRLVGCAVGGGALGLVAGGAEHDPADLVGGFGERLQHGPAGECRADAAAAGAAVARGARASTSALPSVSGPAVLGDCGSLVVA